MAKTKTKIDAKAAKAEITAEYIKKGLKFKEVASKKKPVADPENKLFKEYKAKLAALRRPAWVE